MAALTFNPSTHDAKRGGAMKLSPAWSTQQVPGQAELHGMILYKKERQKDERKKDRKKERKKEGRKDCKGKICVKEIFFTFLFIILCI